MLIHSRQEDASQLQTESAHLIERTVIQTRAELARIRCCREPKGIDMTIESNELVCTRARARQSATRHSPVAYQHVLEGCLP